MVKAKVAKKKKAAISSKGVSRTSKKLKAAVIGVGAIGKHHARNYSQIDNVDLVAVCDLDSKLGKQIAGAYNTKYYKNYRQMLQKEKPDLVSICVPTRSHFSVAKDVIESGVHLLVEKPITANVDEGRVLIDEANKKGVKMSVGHIERFNPVILKLADLIDKGRLGTIVSLMVRRAGTIPNRVKDANVIVDIGVHDIDLLNFLLGKKPENIYASGGRAILRKHEDYADIFLEYPAHKNGLRVTGHIQVNWITPVKIRKLNITGTKAYAVLNLITQDLILFNTDYTQEFDDFEDFVGKFKESRGVKIPVEIKEPLTLQLEKFIASIIDNTDVFVSPEDALWALRLAHTATEQIRIKDNRI
ncbi:Gfo/Idh/MocA family oxidoreductase [Patescibacteria group bacterium]|nr:Gfo/Idh/MocA family oxidoreductase [Patescibacteria group bacterium]